MAIVPMAVRALEPCDELSSYLVGADGAMLMRAGEALYSEHIKLMKSLGFATVYAVADHREAMQVREDHGVVQVKPLRCQPDQVLEEPVLGPTGMLLVKAGETINRTLAERLVKFGVTEVTVRLGKDGLHETRQFQRGRDHVDRELAKRAESPERSKDEAKTSAKKPKFNGRPRSLLRAAIRPQQMAYFVNCWNEITQDYASASFVARQTELTMEPPSDGVDLWISQLSGAVRGLLVVGIEHDCASRLAGMLMGDPYMHLTLSDVQHLVERLVVMLLEDTTWHAKRAGEAIHCSPALAVGASEGRSVSLPEGATFCRLPLKSDMGWMYLAFQV